MLEAGDGHRRRQTVYLGELDQVRLSGRPVQRRGPRNTHSKADAVDITDLFQGGAPVIVTAIDAGGWVMSTDVFLRVKGARAVHTLAKVRVEEME